MIRTPLPPAARQAIIQGVYANHPLANLELLGLPMRILESLKNSRYQVITLEDLVSLSCEDVLSIKSLGEQSLERILECLGRYNELTRPSSIFNPLPQARRPWALNSHVRERTGRS